MSLSQIVCLKDLEKHASRVLPKMAWDYYRSGADAEVTLAENENAFLRYRLYPRILRSVDMPSLSTTIQGHPAAHCLAHPDGEKATARAAASAGTCMCLSTHSTVSLEDVAAVGTGLKWFQLYVCSDVNITLRLIKRVEKCGYKAIVVTVDTPLIGLKYSDVRNKFALPSHLNLANFVNEDMQKLPDAGSGPSGYYANLIDPNSNWEILDWLKSVTSLPIILKGIQTGEDALLAVKHGAEGIWVSNHGARQLDTVPASIDMLYEIVQHVNSRKVEIYMDGGVRYGTNVLVALALGARAVFVGRPALWGLSYAGEEGVSMMLELLRKELSLALTLSGSKDVHSVSKELVRRESYLSKL